MLAAVHGGASAVLVVRGEAGVGKSALLRHLTASASEFHVIRAVGVEGEIDLPYAGLQQLCRSMMGRIDDLPQPQRAALRVAFGLATGPAPDRYIVGLAVLSLMSETATTQPLLCIVDDAQWLDPETTRALAFVARRLGADSVGLVIATREEVEELAGVPELKLGGLAPAAAAILLDSALVGHLDARVRERFLAETRGNPLALLELPNTLTSAEAATGILRRADEPLSSRIEDSFRRRLEPLPEDTRRLLLVAAAEPLGDPLPLHRAAAQLGLSTEAADAAEDAGLLEIRERVSFRHPLVRSAVYGAATQAERRQAHAALAEATDPQLDPDRRAWHRAQATTTPDEDIAAELERTAARAKSRGGLAAAGAFLDRAAALTPSGGARARRALAAAEVLYESGSFSDAERLLRALDPRELDPLQAARAERLDAELALNLRGTEKQAVLQLLNAADRLRHLDPPLARATQILCLQRSFFLQDREVLEAVGQMLAADDSDSGGFAELFVRGWAQLLERGFPAGTQLLREAALALRDKPELDESELPLLLYSEGVTRSSWDFDNWEAIVRRTVLLARDSGALATLPHALGSWADVKVAAGEFAAAGSALAEAEAIADVTHARHEWDSASLAARRFEEAEALARIDELEQRAEGVAPSYFDCARALVYNGAGRYDLALEAAQRSCDRHPLGTFSWGLLELVEAAARCGEHKRAGQALAQLVERTRLFSTEWALGLEARSAALSTRDRDLAQSRYREAVERLDRARTRPDLARAHLVYGEWLRREGRRLDAREQLRAAYDLFEAIGMPVFAERTRRELVATGEKPRKRTDETRADLTTQESQIARLAAEGLTNAEIGAQLFLSPRTVEWHLRQVYAKLGIRSRRKLRNLLHAI